VIALFMAGGLALVISLVGTPFLISWLRANGLGQPIREDGPEGHVTKAGTPTMGGVAIVAAAVTGYLVAHLREGAIFTWGGLLALMCMAGAGFVGFLDDLIKVRHARSLGLTARTKFAGLLAVAITFAVLAEWQADVPTEISFTREQVGIELGSVGRAVFAVLLIVGFSNAVNLTDGLDGLAAGSATFGFSAYVVMGYWVFRHPTIYDVPQGLDLALVAASLAGACAGFLWWNAAPARVFMGDTGSLAIGAGLASLALMTNTDLLLPVVGGIFVVETASVMIQVAVFRYFHRRTFLMAPIHHHFELTGWPETTVIIRFWILAGLSTAFAVGIFYADYLSVPGAT
jgi:phospho-N-acetylmuramoyl-pentapeptide-transferase